MRLRWSVWLLSFGVGLQLFLRRVRRRRVSTKAEEPLDAVQPMLDIVGAMLDVLNAVFG